MTHRGKGSLRKRCLNEAESYISRNSYYDKRLCESCSQTTDGELYRHLYERFGDVDLAVFYHYPEGVVLTDSRCRGISQRLIAIGDE